MRKLNKTTLALACTGGLIACLGLHALAVSGPTALPASDPMLSAARPSGLAAQSVLVAVTRAGDRLVAVGERGHVLLSDDQGGHWRQAEVPASVTLTAVRFVDARRGWAVGHSGVILHSEDGGEHWTRQFDGRQALQALQQSADASTDPALQERVKRQLQDGPDKPFLALHFSDDRHGLAVGAYGWAFATDDGGAHWTPLLEAIANPEERHLYALHERADGLYLAGEQGLVWRRAPGERRFSALDTHSQSTVFELLSSPGGALLAIGLGGKVLRSTDQGRSWQSSQPAGKAALTAGAVLPGLPDGVVLASEAGQWLVSRDGGQHFQAADAPPYPTSSLSAGAKGHLLAVGPLGAQALTLPLPASE